MKLSEHFNLNEFTRSETGDRLGYDNEPGPEELTRLITLCSEVLEPIRAILGAPISILSGYRGAELNTKIGGAESSQHCRGEAADFIVFGETCREVVEVLKYSNVPFDQMILEYPSKSQPDGAWVHISCTSKPRKQILTATKTAGGKTTYTLGIKTI